MRKFFVAAAAVELVVAVPGDQRVVVAPVASQDVEGE